MKYLLTFIVEERTMSNASVDEMRDAMEAWTAFDEEAIAAGALIACEPVESAVTTLRLRGDEAPLVTDGPFADTKEQLGGFCLLECENADEARAWAERIPMTAGAIEIRAVMDLSPFGYRSRTPGPVGAAA